MLRHGVGAGGRNTTPIVVARSTPGGGTMSMVLDGALTSRGGSMGDATAQTTGRTAMLTVGYRR